ncbi:MAG: MBOAT family O-acyltransferase [Candidatus Latescibacteria bacterium]|nr:MBOAT family O-acyltransferase [Candidatus Latescibacterota bacterium]
MLFHSWTFALFFAVVYLGYLPLRGKRLCLWWLLIASYVFYAWWNPLYLLIIVYSSLLDYSVVVMMARAHKKKPWLALSIVNNLLLLSLFKYGAFVSESLASLFDRVGIPLTVPSPGVLLPVGISFYIFQSMSYTIDFYRGDVERERSLVRYAAFVALFPQLVAGPIERARNLLPQLAKRRPVSPQHVSDGLSLFLVGLFKKVALADYLALYVDRVYAAPELFDSLSLMLATFAFGWQIYFDFSGYTDMARGVARMMGYNLMLNFNHPYLATGLEDFWNRWHISLSSWFRDYVYIPLGGNRRGRTSTYWNMFLTMVISGLWHGAAWSFVAWGAVHGAGRLLTRDLERHRFYREHVPKLLKQLWVFGLVTFAWIFFRAESLDSAIMIIQRIFAGGFGDPGFPVVALLLCLTVWVYQLLCESRARFVLEWSSARIALALGMLLILVFSAPSHEPFIYFQF